MKRAKGGQDLEDAERRGTGDVGQVGSPGNEINCGNGGFFTGVKYAIFYTINYLFCIYNF